MMMNEVFQLPNSCWIVPWCENCVLGLLQRVLNKNIIINLSNFGINLKIYVIKFQAANYKKKMYNTMVDTIDALDS